MKPFELFNEDCLSTMDLFLSESIDCVITSPPYDNLRKYKGFIFEFEKIAKELYRVLKQGGVMVWVVSDATIKGSESGTSFKQALYFMSLGFNLHDTMIYKKHTCPLNHNRYEQDFEYMFIFSKGKPKTFTPIKIDCVYFGKDSDRTGQKFGTHNEKNKRLGSGRPRTNIKATKIKGNIWEYGVGFGKSTKDKVAFEHPAIFPEKLAEDHILSWTVTGDLVYDPFNGSGTVAKMCLIHGRKFKGSEISKEYCIVTEKRLAPLSYLL